MLTRIADIAAQWLAAQTILPAAVSLDARKEVGDFFTAFLASPFRAAGGGSRFNKLLWLALLAKALRPTLIVDSGTFAGASAWALSFGAPDAPVLSFDVDLSQLRLRQPNCRYFQDDWSRHDLAGHDLSRALCYFDDHVDQVRRLLEAQGRGIPFAIFDDDLPLSCFALMAPSPAQLPKLEFIDDPALAHGDLVEWTWHGAPRRWIVDQNYLAKGRAAIKAAERLPDFRPVTGTSSGVFPVKLVAINTEHERGLAG